MRNFIALLAMVLPVSQAVLADEAAECNASVGDEEVASQGLNCLFAGRNSKAGIGFVRETPYANGLPHGSELFAFLMMLAFLIDQVQRRCTRPQHHARVARNSGCPVGLPARSPLLVR